MCSLRCRRRRDRPPVRWLRATIPRKHAPCDGVRGRPSAAGYVAEGRVRRPPTRADACRVRPLPDEWKPIYRRTEMHPAPAARPPRLPSQLSLKYPNARAHSPMFELNIFFFGHFLLFFRFIDTGPCCKEVISCARLGLCLRLISSRPVRALTLYKT